MPRKGITADRKSQEKLDFLVNNFNSHTRQELANSLNESPRWVKRQIKLLKEKGLLNNKRDVSDEIVWPEKITQRAIDLRTNKLSSAEDISKVLKEEFNFEVPTYTVEHHLINKIGCKFPSKEEWLHKHLPYDYAKKLIEKGNRISDISFILKRDLGVYVSDDIILLYIKKIGLVSLREYEVNKINEKVSSVDKSWIEDKIKGRINMVNLCKEMGASKTVVIRRLKKENLKVIDDRKIWSKNLEYLRDYLINLPKPDFIMTKEDIHQCILGWLAGDGHLNKDGRFVINHSLAQLSYLYVKRQVLYSNYSTVTTVPAQHYSMAKDSIYLGGKEQIGISCLGLVDYLKYLNEDGSKNFEKIISELTDLGWACYYMDDGSFFSGGLTLSMSEKRASYFENKYNFGEIIKTSKSSLKIKSINADYVIPCMDSKVPLYSNLGSFWMKYFPEIFNVEIRNDFDLCFVNKYITEKSEGLLNRITEYYQKRGFPYFNINDDYLKKEYDKLKNLDTKYIWRDEHTVKYLDVGNRIFKNFMPHMAEASYRGNSPYSTFNGFSSLRSALVYTLKSNKTILPDFLFNSLVYFNGGVAGFPCGVAKAIVEKYTAPGDLVVDPCAGWGGRLLGAASSSRSYFGFELWDKTINGLNSIIDYYDLQDRAQVICSDFDSSKAPKSCNLILTSPPYIDLEVYGKSMNKEKWMLLINKMFLYAEMALVPGGFFVLNIPRYLKEYLPKTSLLEKETKYWFTSSRKRDLSSAELLLVWQKL
jgi:DNA-binding MarR family transcriptional regulator